MSAEQQAHIGASRHTGREAHGCKPSCNESARCEYHEDLGQGEAGAPEQDVPGRTGAVDATAPERQAGAGGGYASDAKTKKADGDGPLQIDCDSQEDCVDKQHGRTGAQLYEKAPLCDAACATDALHHQVDGEDDKGY